MDNRRKNSVEKRYGTNKQGVWGHVEMSNGRVSRETTHDNDSGRVTTKDYRTNTTTSELNPERKAVKQQLRASGMGMGRKEWNAPTWQPSQARVVRENGTGAARKSVANTIASAMKERQQREGRMSERPSSYRKRK